MRLNLKLLTSSSLLLLLFVLSIKIAAAQSNIGFNISPSKETVSAGETLELTINMNTGGQKVNSYITNLTYPQNKLTFESIDTATSPFTMALEAKGENGVVNIIRGTTTSVSGEALVGKVTFKATGNTAAKEILISNDSAIISSDNKNILPGSSVTESASTNASPNPSMTDVEDIITTQPNFFIKIISSISTFFSSLFK